MNLINLAVSALGDIGGGSMGINPFSVLGGRFTGVMILFLIVGLVIFIYLALAHMRIAKRAGQSDSVAGTAWIIGLGGIIIPYIVSGMSWWPWLLLMIGYCIMMLGASLMLVSSILSIILIIFGVIIFIVFGVFTIIWNWKMFKVVKRPGWWALLPVILGIIGYLIMFFGAIVFPLLSLIGLLLAIVGGILYLVFIGIAAWGKTT